MLLLGVEFVGESCIESVRTDKVLYDLLKAQYLKIEFSPNGGTASSKKTRYTFDFTRESFSISPAVNGIITIQASGKVENIVQDVW